MDVTVGVAVCGGGDVTSTADVTVTVDDTVAVVIDETVDIPVSTTFGANVAWYSR